MGPIERNIWGVIAGLAVCCVAILYAGGAMTVSVCPLPRVLDPSIGKSISRYLTEIPAVAPIPAAVFVRMIAAPYVLGAFSGGLVAGLIIGGGKLWPGLAVSAFPLLVTLLMAMAQPSSLWVVAAAFMLEPLAALAGAKLAGVLRKPPSPSGPQQHDMRRENMAC